MTWEGAGWDSLYYKASVIKTVWNQCKEKYTNKQRKLENLETVLPTGGQLTFETSAGQARKGRVFSVPKTGINGHLC